MQTQNNKYEVLAIVGEGAYGIVYKCRNKETNEIVAIKKFKEVTDEIVKKTMKRELRMLQQLSHENIVNFKEAFKRKANLFLVFEYVERNLLELLQEHPRGLEPKLIRSLIYQLCKAIKYLHDKSVIHRDIKPENLLVNNAHCLKLCDFGFARTIKCNTQEQLTDYVATRWYRAPELLLTQGIYGQEVDYWAIGCIMGELVDGNPLFPGENELDQLHCIQKVIGNFTEEQNEMFYSNPLFHGKRLLDVNKPETLERRYLGKLPKVAISFMKGLLMVDPNKRLNGDSVFTHPYFEKMVESDKAKSVKQHGSKPGSSRRINIVDGKVGNAGNNNNNGNVMNINIINYNNYGEGYFNNNNNNNNANMNTISEHTNNQQQQQYHHSQHQSPPQNNNQPQGNNNANNNNNNSNNNGHHLIHQIKIKEPESDMNNNNNNNSNYHNIRISQIPKKPHPTTQQEQPPQQQQPSNVNSISIAMNTIALDNVYKTFYQKADKDQEAINNNYNIELDIQTQQQNTYNNPQPIKKQPNKKYYQNQMYKPSTNTNKTYHKNASPPKANAYATKYNSKNLQLPVIPKGSIYTNLNTYKKYTYY